MARRRRHCFRRRCRLSRILGGVTTCSNSSSGEPRWSHPLRLEARVMTIGLPRVPSFRPTTSRSSASNDKHGFRWRSRPGQEERPRPPKIERGLRAEALRPGADRTGELHGTELREDRVQVDSSAKMNVDVLLTDIKFVGALSFVETLAGPDPARRLFRPPYSTSRPRASTPASTWRCRTSPSAC